MSEQNTDWRTLNRIADSIAPRNPSRAACEARHERSEESTSGAALDAIRRVIPEGWHVEWALTGGGCSGWVVRRSDTDDYFPHVLVTGHADGWTEASGDLSRGAAVGLYLAEESDGDGYVEVAASDPLTIARAVRAEVDLILATTEV